MWQLLESTVSEQDLFQAVRMMTGQQYLEVTVTSRLSLACSTTAKGSSPTYVHCDLAWVHTA